MKLFLKSGIGSASSVQFSEGNVMNKVSIKVYPISNNLLDMFFGEGWEDWTRVYCAAKVGQPVSRKDVTILGGTKRSASLLASVVEGFRRA